MSIGVSGMALRVAQLYEQRYDDLRYRLNKADLQRLNMALDWILGLERSFRYFLYGEVEGMIASDLEAFRIFSKHHDFVKVMVSHSDRSHRTMERMQIILKDIESMRQTLRKNYDHPTTWDDPTEIQISRKIAVFFSYLGKACLLALNESTYTSSC